MNETALDSMNMNDLLDSTLDDLEDLPEFKVFNPGAHKVLATFSTKELEVNSKTNPQVKVKKQVVELKLKLIETLELKDPQATLDEPGTECSTIFMLDNQFGRGNLKKCAAPFAESFNFSSIREVVEGVKDVESLVLTGIRRDKKDEDIKYLIIKEVQVV